jgi:hypothetical protein
MIAGIVGRSACDGSDDLPAVIVSNGKALNGIERYSLPIIHRM